MSACGVWSVFGFIVSTGFFLFFLFVVGGLCLCHRRGVCGGYYNMVLFIYMCLPSPIGYIYFNKVITYYFIIAFVGVCFCCCTHMLQLQFTFFKCKLSIWPSFLIWSTENDLTWLSPVSLLLEIRPLLFETRPFLLKTRPFLLESRPFLSGILSFPLKLFVYISTL